MNNSAEYRIALHAPNLINICIDGNKDGMISGRLYHCFAEEAWRFETMVQLIEKMEMFYNSIDFPQASTESRNFDGCVNAQKIELEKVKTQQDIIVHHGTIGTFFVHVQYRQNSSWQGQIEWVEKGVLKQFSSELDLMKLITGAVEE